MMNHVVHIQHNVDFQHREPFSPNPLVAGVVELALVESQYDESRGSYPKRTLWFSKAHTFEGGG